MLARLFGFGFKQPVAVAVANLAETAALQARIRAFVKTNPAGPPSRPRSDTSEWEFIPHARPVVEDRVADPPPPVVAGHGDGRLPPMQEIYLTPEAFTSEDAHAAIQVTIDINNYLMEQAGHTPAEIPEAAMQAYAVDYYRAQVLNGGHGQFIGNCRNQPVTQDMCRSGLAAMEAGPYLLLLEQMQLFMAHNARRAEAMPMGGGFVEIDQVMQALDEKFFALNEKLPLQDIVSPWLKAQPNVVVLPEDEIEKRIMARALHPVIVARAAAIEADRQERESSDPMISLAQKLCLAVGREWQAWDAVIPVNEMDGKIYENVWSMRTNKGKAFMAAFSPGKAALFCHKQTPAGELEADALFQMPEYEHMITLSAPGSLPWSPRPSGNSPD